MTSFVALNIEPESDSEDEIDDSKEIQIEEALKLYQNALKLHSQGPDYYDETEIAYDTLFQSEIFTYLESLSESQRFQFYGSSEIIESGLEHPSTSASVAPGPSVDGAPSTLPQILFLSYKNRAQFLLDRLKSQILRSQKRSGSPVVQHLDNGKAISKTVSSSLDLFTEALDRDDTDLELWRQVAKLSGFLGSKRTERFCLEAVLDDTRGSPEVWREPLGLEESFATEQLKAMVKIMSDHVSETQISARFQEPSNIIKSLKKHMDPCPYLPMSTNDSFLTKSIGNTILTPVAKRREIVLSSLDWASCGKAILFELNRAAQGLTDSEPGASYRIILPANRPQAVEPATIRVKEKALTSSRRRHSLGNSEPPQVRSGQESSAVEGEVLVEETNEKFLSPEIMDPNQSQIERDSNLLIPHGGHTSGQDPLRSGTSKQESSNGTVDLVTADDHEDEQSYMQSQTFSGGNTISLPTRKRSSEVAGLQESIDAGRSRSKRIKARISTAELSYQELAPEDLTQHYEEQLRNYTQADHWMFERAGGFLSRLNAQSLGSLAELKRTISVTRSNDDLIDISASKRSSDVVARDLRGLLCSWDMAASNLFLQRVGLDEALGGVDDGRESSLAAFLEHSKKGLQQASQRPLLSGADGLEEFSDSVNDSWTHLDQVSMKWIEDLLRGTPGDAKATGHSGNDGSAYEKWAWPDTLKEIFVQMLVKQDELIYTTMIRKVRDVDEHFSISGNGMSASDVQAIDQTVIKVTQSIFELHLDIYGRITNPSSEVDLATRTLQLDRLSRWAGLASHAYSHRPTSESGVPDHLAIRFLWSFVVYINLVDPASRDHIVLCFQDLRRVMEGAGSPIIELPNNAVIPQLSVEAAEREISWLTTMDFFVNVFSTKNNDPLTTIESLEPILESSLKRNSGTLRGQSISPEEDEETASRSQEIMSTGHGLIPPLHQIADHKLEQMMQFLDKASVPLKLLLWRKLGRAYEAIHYSPRILSGNLRCIELIMQHFRSSAYADSSAEKRRVGLSCWLRILDDLIVRILPLALNDPAALDCMDESHLQASMEAIAALQRILHVFALWEDSVRISQTMPPNQVNAAAANAHSTSKQRFRDMLVRTWTLQYVLFREAVKQNSERFETPSEDLADYLKIVHHALGLRYYCKDSNKIFLRLMKAELLRLRPEGGWETDVAQVLFDLYGMKICPNSIGSQDHGCPSETLGRQTAIEIMDLVMVQANRMNIKDLLKSDLRPTIEKLHNALKGRRETARMKFNRHLFSKYLRSPINPVFLYRALRGIGDLSGASVVNEDSPIAEKGWFFLQGHIALARYRSQKRTSQGPVDDLDNASAFFKQDLEFDMERWETWYRLGQVYDAKIEEDTTWNAEKLNNQMEELNSLQRYAIHCYAMAIAVAKRTADVSFESINKISDLYADFGLRIYSSSREPFCMGAFSLENFGKYFNEARVGMYQNRPFRDMRLYPAWKFASVLFRLALEHKPQEWLIWYMLGKCLWKMHNCDYHIRGNVQRISYQLALDAFRRAIDTLPEKRDGRHPEKDPTLEPHYKLVSVVHKLVQTRRLQPEDACRYLEATPYARKVPAVHDLEDWEGYMIQVLKTLRYADKSNWHHRMVARAAHTIYDDSPDDPKSALGAKHELTQQIFTKTMSIQIWRPENERPGRHFVYTSRYVSFFVRLSFQLNDRASLEALAKRIRKRSGDFFHHAHIWSEVCRTYLDLLRRAGSVPEEYPETIFKALPHEHFMLNADRLESWAHSPSRTSPNLDLLHEVVELKRLNSTLIKPGPIEDLVADTYAQLYHTTVPDLIAKSNDEESKARMRVDHLLMNTDGPVDTPSPDNRPGAGEPAPKQRTKGVSKREILKRAEALLSKPSAPPPSAMTKLSSVTIPFNQPPTLQQPDQEPPRGLAILAVKEDPAAVAAKDASSVPGSLHDSADDESELSEIEELAKQVAPKPLFPGLASAASAGAKEAKEAEVEVEDSESEGEGEGKGEKEGEEEEEEGEGDEAEGVEGHADAVEEGGE